MENFEFKSQICTTRSQSETLLKLGLKKETADMWHYKDSYGWRVSPIEEICNEKAFLEYGTPAWSLHRLFELIRDEKKGILIYAAADMYDTAIAYISNMVKENRINPQFLEDKK